jgi:hypothetical protein
MKLVLALILSTAVLSFPLSSASKTARSAAEVLAFKRHNPCPATGERHGACPGYQVDHVMPLCAGGAEKIENMQWLSVEDHRVNTRADNRVCRHLRKI